MTAKADDLSTPLPPIVERSRRLLRLEFQSFPKSVEMCWNDPRPGCLFLTDQEEWKSQPHRQGAHRRRLRNASIQLTRLLLVSIIDHIWATAQVFSGDTVPLYSHSSTSRPAMEAAAKVAYLLDDQISYLDRTTRTAVLEIEDAEQAKKAARSVPSGHPSHEVAIQSTTERLRGIISLIERSGTPMKNGAVAAISRSGKLTELHFRITDEVDRHFSRLPGIYRYSSGTAHGMSWMLADASSSDDSSGLTLQPDLLVLGSSTLACLDASICAVTALAKYFGHDPARLTVSTERRYKAIDQLMTDVGMNAATERQA